MPSSATITSFYSFTALTTIRSSEVNTNFSNYRGHILPVDPNTSTAATTNTYDLGADDHRWRYVYGKVKHLIVSTTGSMTLTHTTDIALMNSTAATITATLPTAVGNTGSTLIIKNIGTAGKTVYVDANSTETIDSTLTVNIVDGEAIALVSDGSNWWAI